MKGILFKSYLQPLVRSGAKTKTRRIIDPQPPQWVEKFGYSFYTPDGCLSAFGPHPELGIMAEKFYRHRYQPGEVVYMKEQFYAWGKYVKDGLSPNGKQKYRFIDRSHPKDELSAWWYMYSDNPPELSERKEWLGYHKRNPMFMPVEAARTFLKITDVRAERICDISEEDCFAEGIYPWTKHIGPWDSPHNTELKFKSPNEAFFALIRSVNKDVDLNAWVWVYSFELTEKPTKP